MYVYQREGRHREETQQNFETLLMTDGEYRRIGPHQRIGIGDRSTSSWLNVVVTSKFGLKSEVFLMIRSVRHSQGSIPPLYNQLLWLHPRTVFPDSRDHGYFQEYIYPCTNSPIHPFTNHLFTCSPFHPVHPFKPSPLHPLPLHHFTLSPLHHITPSPVQPSPP